MALAVVLAVDRLIDFHVTVAAAALPMATGTTGAMPQVAPSVEPAMAVSTPHMAGQIAD